MDTVPISMAAAVAADQAKFVKKKKKTSEDFVEHGVKGILGVTLASTTANLID